MLPNPPCSSRFPYTTLFRSVLTYTVTPVLGDCVGIPVDFTISVEPAPAVTQEPVSQTVCLNGMVDPLIVVWEGTGTPVYEWFSGPSNAGPWTSLSNSNNYIPPTDALGITYYYCEISFPSGGCSLISSEVVFVEVVEGLQIDTEPIAEQSVCVDGQADVLEVMVSGGAGTVSYQWFSNTNQSNTGGTPI